MLKKQIKAFSRSESLLVATFFLSEINLIRSSFFLSNHIFVRVMFASKKLLCKHVFDGVGAITFQEAFFHENCHRSGDIFVQILGWC